MEKSLIADCAAACGPLYQTLAVQFVKTQPGTPRMALLERLCKTMTQIDQFRFCVAVMELRQCAA